MSEVESMPVVMGQPAILPDIVPLEVEKKHYMTEKRKIAIEKARKSKSQKSAVRAANKGRAIRALKGVKSIFMSLNKRNGMCLECEKRKAEQNAPPPPPKAEEPRRIPKLIGGRLYIYTILIIFRAETYFLKMIIKWNQIDFLIINKKH
jgi:hypothetical protein